MTLAFLATCSAAPTSSSAPTTTSPTELAGAPSLGSRNANEHPNGIPASPSMRPSCPPPNTATCVTGCRLEGERKCSGVRFVVAAQGLDLVEGPLQGAMTCGHQRAVLLGGGVELLLHLVELDHVLLPLPG